MKKFIVPALLCALTLGSCQAISFPTSPAPSVDVQGTTNALIQTANAQTLAAQPSPTTAPPTATVTPILAEPSPTSTVPTPTIDLFASTLTTTPVTATSGPTNISTATPTTVPGQITEIPTLTIRTYGTLPPQNRPFTQITILNRSKAECYISLQIETDQGYTIIEYPVEKMVRINIPTGEYTYVVWVGGRQFVGYFHAPQDIEPVITIYRDKVVIK